MFRQIGRFPSLVLRRPGSTPKPLIGWRPYAALHREVAAFAPDLGPERRADSRDRYRAYWHSIIQRELDVQEESPEAAPDQLVQ